MAGEAPALAAAAPGPTALPGRHFTNLEDSTAVLVELPELDGQPNIQAIKREVLLYLLLPQCCYACGVPCLQLPHSRHQQQLPELVMQVALLSPWMNREVTHNKRGTPGNAIPMPKQVRGGPGPRLRAQHIPSSPPTCAAVCKQVATSDVLDLLLDYCQFHHAAGRSDKARLPHPAAAAAAAAASLECSR